MAVKFAVLYIKSNAGTTLKQVGDMMVQTVKSFLKIREVNYSEFQTYTRSKPISRYIMLAKEEARKKIEDAKEMLSNGIKYKLDTNLGGFHAIKTKEKDVYDHAKMADPSYAIIDVHQISATEFAIMLNRNPGIPIYNHLFLQKIAVKLCKLFMTAVMAVDDYRGTYIEHLSYYVNGSAVKNVTVPAGAKLMSEFMRLTTIDINNILKTADMNIDILMAPYDLSDYNAILAKQLESKVFMEGMNAHKPNADPMIHADYLALLSELKITEENIGVINQRIRIDPPIDSRYIKFDNPPELEAFAKRPLTSIRPEGLY